MRNAGLEETQAGIKIAGRNINNLRYADYATLMAESEEELKSLLMKVNPRHDEDLREPLVRRQGSQVSMCVARGSVLGVSEPLGVKVRAQVFWAWSTAAHSHLDT